MVEDDETPEADMPSDAMSREQLGTLLAGLRKERRLSGERLGGLVGMSQGKISKLERGVLRPSPEDVERIVRALDRQLPVGIELERDLVEKARRLRTSGPQRRSDPVGRGAPRQQDYLDAESNAVLIRNFEPIAVPGLLQIDQYTRRLVNAFHAVTVGDDKAHWPHTAATVALRAQRQKLLYDTSKTFQFVLMESVLSNLFATPGVMLAQVDRIEQASMLDNVTIRIVRNFTELPYAPVLGISLFDDQLVITEALDATIWYDERTIGNYAKFFETYFERADGDLGPILEVYKAIYADLARPKPNEHTS
jgi:transcriptional regulator with XRE-family HTH domain